MFCIAVVMFNEIGNISGQITFSKDWRAGGKRSVGGPSISFNDDDIKSTLAMNKMTELDVPCDRIGEHSNKQIKDLVRVSSIKTLY